MSFHFSANFTFKNRTIKTSRVTVIKHISMQANGEFHNMHRTVQAPDATQEVMCTMETDILI